MFGLVVCGALAGCAFAAQDPAPGVPVSMVVTVEAKRGKTVPAVEQQDLKVAEDRTPRAVTGFIPLRGEHGGLQLMLLVDDSARESFDTEIGSIKQWINSLPTGVEVAVGYMRNGMAAFTQQFTADHGAAANAVRLPFGAAGGDVSPYDSLSDAIKKWPVAKAERREVVMISSGIEALGGGIGMDNPYVNKGIADAQRAGMVIFTIYSPSVGHYGHSFWRETIGQSFLSQLADETGGESYINTIGPPVSFAPFLEEIGMRLQNQYLLTFDAKPEKKAGLQPVRVQVNHEDADVAAADKVFVKASM
jgi:hypothetical protein